MKLSKKLTAAVIAVLAASVTFTACANKDAERNTTDVSADISVSEAREELIRKAEKEANGIVSKVELNKTTLKELIELGFECASVDIEEKCEFNVFGLMTELLLENGDECPLFIMQFKKGAGETYGDCIITGMEKYDGTFTVGDVEVTDETTVQDFIDAGWECDLEKETLDSVNDGDTALFMGTTISKDGMIYDVDIVADEGEKISEAEVAYIEFQYNEADRIK